MPAAHRPVDLAGWDADYVAFSGHKTYAPFGAGVLAGRSDWLDAGTPYLVGGGATAAVTETGTTWATGPARHEGGSPNVIGAIAIAAACATIRAHRELIETHEERLLERLRAGLDDLNGVEQLSIFDDTTDQVGVTAFTVAGFDSSLISQILSVEHGIGGRRRPWTGWSPRCASSPRSGRAPRGPEAPRGGRWRGRIPGTPCSPAPGEVLNREAWRAAPDAAARATPRSRRSQRGTVSLAWSARRTQPRAVNVAQSASRGQRGAAGAPVRA